MKDIFLFPLLSALGAFGTAYGLFSYIGDAALLWSAITFAITLALSFLGSIKKGAVKLLPLALVLLLAAPLLFRETFPASGLAVLSSLVDILKDPYDLDMVAPKVPAGATPFACTLYLSLLLSYFFTAGSFSLFARGVSGMLALFVLLLGFYFGVSVPSIAAVLSAAYLLTIPVSFFAKGLGRPELPVFGISILLGLALLVVVPESRYVQPGFLASAQEKILSATDPYDPIFHAGNGYTGMMKGAAGRQTLGKVNGIRYTGRIIADIESAEISSPLYIRSWTGGAYEGNQWKDLPDSDYDDYQRLFAKNQGEWYDQGAWLMEVIARNPSISEKLLNYTDKSNITEYKAPFTLAAQYEKSRFFLLPYDADFGARVFLYDRSPMSAEGKAYSTDLWQLPAGALVSMMSREAISDPYYRTYMEGERLYRAFVYSHYLTVPEDVKEAIAALHPMDKAVTLSEKRARIEEIYNFLDAHYAYTKNPGKTPAGKDFISYFLSESKKGYCTSFASAAVMLLRSAGIPARYAVGLSVSEEEINEAPLAADGLHSLAVNDHHAHAWAEVYVDGLGWRPVEMTPGQGGGENPFPNPAGKEKNNTGAPDAPAKENPQGQSPKQEGTPPKQPQGNPVHQPSPQNPAPPPTAPAASADATGFPYGAILAALLPLLAMALLLTWRLSAIPCLLASDMEDEKNFRRLLAYGEHLAHWAGHKTSGSYAARAASYQKDPRLTGFDRIIDLLVKSKFSGAPLTIEEKQEIQSIITGARRATLQSLPLLKRLKARVVEGV